MGRLTPGLIIAPVAALAIAWLVVLAAEGAGAPPLFGLAPRNLAEAAAFRDGAAIVRGIARGEDPAAAAEVRGGFISRETVVLTPIEAAARGSREEVVRLLLDLGTRVDAATWTRAWCSTEAAPVRDELSRARPDGATTECR